MYATGLLAIGLAANEACAEAVRNGMAVELAKVGCPLHLGIAGNCEASPLLPRYADMCQGDAM